MKNALLALLLLAVPVFPGAMAQAADAPRKARVATGAEVTLLASARSPAQWMALRPKVRNLRPRARGNFD
jgi:hypothetical protein